MVGQITGHLWHHFAGSWAHMSWLELALSLCLCHTLSLTHSLCTHRSSHYVTAVTETFPLLPWCARTRDHCPERALRPSGT